MNRQILPLEVLLYLQRGVGRCCQSLNMVASRMMEISKQCKQLFEIRRPPKELNLVNTCSIHTP